MQFKDLPVHHLEEQITAKSIHREDERIAGEIYRDFPNLDLSLITVLRGAKPFAKALKYHLSRMGNSKNLQTDKFRVESYGEKDVSSHDPRVLIPLSHPERTIYKKDVVLVEDIVDKGYTMFLCALPYILQYEPNSLVIASMLTKNSQRDPIASDLPLKYFGQDIDFFAVHRGLDWLEFYREGDSVAKVVIH